MNAGWTRNYPPSCNEGRNKIARYQRTETSRGGVLKYFCSGCGILERIAGEHGEELGDWVDRKRQLRAGEKPPR